MSATIGYPPNESSGRAAAVQVRRFVNDEIVETARRFRLDKDGQIEFLCECGELSCEGRVKMTVAEYRASAPGSVFAH